MQNAIRWFILSMTLLMLNALAFEASAQNRRPRNKAWPDTLTLVTLEGTVIVDSAYMNVYFLDVDGDLIADYNLAFGPAWYVPASGAVRPIDGAVVTVAGVLNTRPTLPVLIVFELNDLLWREPVENWWSHQDWCDSLEVVTLTGAVLVDTTYFYTHYYLDLDADGAPEYELSFGPPWYEPASGATRPAAGDVATVEGIIKETAALDRLVVLKLNDLIWRDPQGPAPWTGGWLGKEHGRARRVYCPIDSASWLELPPGAMQGGGHSGPQFPDSIFCEFMKTWCDSLPGRPDSAFAGWHFHFSNPAGRPVNGKGVAVRFIKRLRMQLSYGDSCNTPMPKMNSAEVVLKTYDASTGDWIEAENATYDVINHVVSVESETVDAYYALFMTSEATTDVGHAEVVARAFELQQNYPNPFNPTTTIAYQLSGAMNVKLAVFNLLGQEVRRLQNDYQPAGSYQIVWDGRDHSGKALPSGLYVYKLDAGGQTQIRRLVMLK